MGELTQEADDCMVLLGWVGDSIRMRNSMAFQLRETQRIFRSPGHNLEVGISWIGLKDKTFTTERPTKAGCQNIL